MDLPITGWHAHVYYDPATTRAAAEALREGIAAGFPGAVLGRWHDVGLWQRPLAASGEPPAEPLTLAAVGWPGAFLP